MKTLAWVAALLLALAVPAMAQANDVAVPPPPQVTAGPLDSAAWDYSDAHLATYQVTRFEMCVDGATTGCATVEPAAGKFTPETSPPPAGTSAYRLKLPAMTPGNHTLSVRACNATACSDPTPLVAFVMEIKPPSATWRGFVSGGS